MAVTEFQRGICKLIAANRIAQGVSYVAGGVALNTLMGTPRISRDIDLFHDTDAAVGAAWGVDRKLLEQNEYSIEVLREQPSFVEALVESGANSVLMQWARDSAYRFFPLVEDEIFGLTLHPFDLATNKVLAMTGRLEARDWVDVINCHEKIQNVGYLFWAACGKDPGFSPAAILTEAGRSSHYSAEEIAQMPFEGPAPDAATLGRQWHQILKESETIISLLPAEEAGKCVLAPDGTLFRGGPDVVAGALRGSNVRFHAGSIRGAWPRVVDRPLQEK